MKIKFLHKEKDEPRYLVEWETGYFQFWEDWSQFLHPERYNWLNFRPIWFEIDYCKMCGEYVGIEFGLMGLNLRFHQLVRENEKSEEMKKDIKEFETIEQAHKKEIKKLKNEIAGLRKKVGTK